LPERIISLLNIVSKHISIFSLFCSKPAPPDFVHFLVLLISMINLVTKNWLSRRWNLFVESIPRTHFSIFTFPCFYFPVVRPQASYPRLRGPTPSNPHPTTAPIQAHAPLLLFLLAANPLQPG
jgi:hypothetical protein